AVWRRGDRDHRADEQPETRRQRREVAEVTTMPRDGERRETKGREDAHEGNPTERALRLARPRRYEHDHGRPNEVELLLDRERPQMRHPGRRRQVEREQ